MSRRGNGDPALIAAGLRNHFVYRVYDADGEVLYVGCTRSPERRWAAHRWQNKDMVAEAQTCRLAGPYDYGTARRIEELLIHKHQPYFNSYGTGYVHEPHGRPVPLPTERVS